MYLRRRCRTDSLRLRFNGSIRDHSALRLCATWPWKRVGPSGASDWSEAFKGTDRYPKLDALPGPTLAVQPDS